jgi:hypothetical protein
MIVLYWIRDIFMPEIVYKFSTLENVVCYKGGDLSSVIINVL